MGLQASLGTWLQLLWAGMLLGLLAACASAGSPSVASATAALDDDLATSQAAVTATRTASPEATAEPDAAGSAGTERPEATEPSQPDPAPEATPVPALPAQRTDSSGNILALIPAGSFEMGKSGARADEAPPHLVYLEDFYLDIYEVTNEQFAAFLNQQGNQVEDGVPWLDNLAIEVRIHQRNGVWSPDPGYADHPAVEITWYGANAYCAWRGARLPTEAEWEKAARGTDGRDFPWGDGISCDLAQYGECGGQTLPVGSFPAGVSPYGIHDMAGNAWEWTADWYAADYYLVSPSENPPGPAEGAFKVTRGGAWFYVADHQRTTFRNHARPSVSYSYVGFRCASSP